MQLDSAYSYYTYKDPSEKYTTSYIELSEIKLLQFETRRNWRILHKQNIDHQIN
jgi:hypothetical protein